MSPLANAHPPKSRSGLAASRLERRIIQPAKTHRSREFFAIFDGKVLYDVLMGIRSIFLPISILTFAACASNPSKYERSPAQDAGSVLTAPPRYPLDAHVHYSIHSKLGQSGQELFLKQDRFDHAFLISPTYLIADIPKDEAWIEDDRNEALIPKIHREVSDYIIRHPDRFTGLCGLHLAWKNPVQRTVECLKLPGMRGIKIHSNHSGIFAHIPENREKLDATLHAVSQLQPFVLWHLGVDEELRVVYELARKFREITFIIAHVGAGLPQFDELSKWIKNEGRLQNLWTEVSLSWDTRYGQDMAEWGFRRLRTLGFDQMVFGSDISDDPSSFGIRWLDTFEKSSLLSEHEKKVVLVDSPKKLLQLIQMR
jgi:predicted TIM-barrel fold metal-dependent hydrolase